MKKSLLSISLIISFINVKAQVTYSLFENFNYSCASVAGSPADWSIFNPISSTISGGQWTCAPTEGRDGTPGISCTGTYGTPLTYNLDTSYLITPLLDLNTYWPGSVFLNFDSKTTNIYLGGKLNVIQSYSGVDSSGGFVGTDLTDSLFPVIGEGDSSGWVTHQLNLTQFELSGPFYIAFRYTSPTTFGNTWYLDNVNTTSQSILHITNVSKTELPLRVIGSPTSTQISLFYSTEVAGEYALQIYDMMGRVVHTESFNTQIGTYAYNINNLNLMPGMYLVKMGNANNYGTVKAVVQ